MESSVSVVFVAPVKLQGALTVLLKSAPGVRLLADSTNIESLQAALAPEIPDLLLLFFADSTDEVREGHVSQGQLKQIKSLWPGTKCIAFIQSVRQKAELEALGADIVLPMGVQPSRLLKVLETLASKEHADCSHSKIPKDDLAAPGFGNGLAPAES